MKNTLSGRLNLSEFVKEISTGNTVVLAQAITLAESQRSEDQVLANQLIEELLPLTGKSIRIGITGVPGVGKSTFIETFGKLLTSHSKKIAVLAVDP
ncbi:MAG: P-loop NTPase fold protein, partial [Cyclobacteriaceae bacterium]